MHLLGVFWKDLCSAATVDTDVVMTLDVIINKRYLIPILIGRFLASMHGPTKYFHSSLKWITNSG